MFHFEINVKRTITNEILHCVLLKLKQSGIRLHNESAVENKLSYILGYTRVLKRETFFFTNPMNK